MIKKESQQDTKQKTIIFFTISSLIIIICYLLHKIKIIQNNLGPTDPSTVIPIGELIEKSISGAASIQGKLDHYDSPYFKEIDFYHQNPTNTLISYKHFKTYQQTTFYTCGCSCALMVLNHLGYTKQTEKSIYLAMKEIQPNFDSCGSTVDTMEKFFRNLGFQTETKNSGDPKKGPIEQNGPVLNPDRLRDYVISAIQNNQYIICISPILGGHWTVFAGIDTMGTETSYDDVIIMADPFDWGDHRQDGYTVYNLHSFLRMWRCILPDHASDGPFNFVKVWKE